jgi:hypothetical protein
MARRTFEPVVSYLLKSYDIRLADNPGQGL